LRRGRRGFTPGFTCRVLLRDTPDPFGISRTGLSPPMAGLSRPFHYPSGCLSEALLPRRDKSRRFGLFRLRSPLLTESHSLSSPPATKMFQFTGYCPATLLDSDGSDCLLRQPGFPIRKSPDQSVLTAPRSLSQLAASFFASYRQGIH
jgi:hypothetical protein